MIVMEYLSFIREFQKNFPYSKKPPEDGKVNEHVSALAAFTHE